MERSPAGSFTRNNCITLHAVGLTAPASECIMHMADASIAVNAAALVCGAIAGELSAVGKRSVEHSRTNRATEFWPNAAIAMQGRDLLGYRQIQALASDSDRGRQIMSQRVV
jgi:hypothetical protein